MSHNTTQSPARRPKLLKGGLGNTLPGKPLIQTQRLLPPNKSQPRKLLRQPAKPRQLIALDTETTGTDFWHGCRAFFVSTLNPDDSLSYWEWDVNPYTRDVGFYLIDYPLVVSTLDKRLQNSPKGKRSFLPLLPTEDHKELTTLIHENDFVLHHAKFDVRALEHHNLPLPDWNGIHDTLIASHVLYSNESHKLKDLALQHLDIRDDDQKALQEATNHARRIARTLSKRGAVWQIAESPEPGQPQHKHFPAQRDSPKDGWWVFDTWLPRAVAKYKWEVEGDPEYAPAGEIVQTGDYAGDQPITEELPQDQGHPWWTVLRDYALRDVERTYGLWLLFQKLMEEDDLLKFYEPRRRMLQAIYEMEAAGVTISPRKIREQREQRAKENAEALRNCIRIGKGAVDESTLRSSKKLQGFIMGNLGLRLTKQNKTGYAVDKDVKQALFDRTVPKPGEKPSPAHEFMRNLIIFGKTEKNDSYLEEYTLRSLPTPLPKTSSTTIIPGSNIRQGTKQEPWLLLHGSFNPTGTDTTRLSSSGPNLQNVSKTIDERYGDYNLRKCFGPMPGREWYSIDYSNIELRIFAYESGDRKLIEAFEQGFKVHCVFAEYLWPKEWGECMADAKKQIRDPKVVAKLNPDSHYDMQLWGLAADIFKERYEKGSLYQWVKNGNFALIYGAGVIKANTTYHHPDGYSIIRQHLPLVDEFLQAKNWEAKQYGHVRILGFGKDEHGRPLGYKLWVPQNEPHVAVNYFVQGSAGWCMVLAINRVHEYLSRLNRELGLSLQEGYKMIMTIHDELDFDFPIHERNHKVISDIARIMEQSGDDIGLPTPVEVERHPVTWAEGEKVKLLVA